MSGKDIPEKLTTRGPGLDSVAFSLAPLRPGTGLAVAIAVLAGLVAFDIVANNVVIIGTYALVPFLTALRGAVRPTTILGGLAVLAAGLSGIWNDNFWELGYLSRLVLVAVAAVIAHYAAVAIARNLTVARQLGLLNQVAAASEERELSEILSRIGDIAVPGVADICLIDALADDRVRRINATVSGPKADALERILTAREPTTPGEVLNPLDGRGSEPHLEGDVSDDFLRSIAHSPEDLELLRSLGIRSFIAVPLVSRGRRIGVMTLVQAWSGRVQDEYDAKFARVFSGRVALVLDNAGLFSDLQGVERRLDVVMEVVDEAVVVNAGDGRLLFANRAAVELAGCKSFDELMRLARAGGRWLPIYTEAGRPLTLEDEQSLNQGRTQFVRLARAPGTDVWLRVRTRSVEDDDGRPLYNVSVLGDVTELKIEERVQAVRAAVSELLLDASGHAEILAGLASTVVPLLADACSVYVSAEDGTYGGISHAGVDPDRARPLRELIGDERLARGDDDWLAGLAGAGHPHVVSDLSADGDRTAIGADRCNSLFEAGIRSLLIVPLRADGEEIAVMVLANFADRLPLGGTERKIASAVADRIALSVENARGVAERSEIAETLQSGLISPPPPEIPGWSLAALHRPAGAENRVGGDFYDFFRIEDGWMAVIGDVTGHGARAATVTALARYTLRTAASMSGDPVAALSELNRSLLARPGGALCTAVIVTIRHGRRDLIELAVAGHPPSLVLRAGRAEQVSGGGPMLGAFEDGEWTSELIELGPGDGVLLYTDGLIEARNGDELYGLDRVIDIASTGTGPSAIVGRLEAAIRSFCDDDPTDDIALLALTRELAGTAFADGT